jgi:hypothetical protein
MIAYFLSYIGPEQRQAILDLDQGGDSFLLLHCNLQGRLYSNEILFSSLRHTEIRTPNSSGIKDSIPIHPIFPYFRTKLTTKTVPNQQ